MLKTIKQLFIEIKEAVKIYLSELSLLFTFFVLVVTISNFTYKVFQFRLIPIVKTALDAFHDWCHLILQTLVFSWVTYFLEWIWYGFTWLCALLLPVIPWRPQITIPGLITDLALVSLAFTRVFQGTDFVIPRSVREQAENNMSPDQWKDIENVEGPFWGPIHRFLDRTNAGIWNLIDKIERLITYPIRRFPRLIAFIRPTLKSLAASILMWGFIRLAGYLINVPKGRHLGSPIMSVRERFLKFFGISLLGAIVATFIFFVVNGWVAEWLEP